MEGNLRIFGRRFSPNGWKETTRNKLSIPLLIHFNDLTSVTELTLLIA